MDSPEYARVIGMLILCSALCGAACGEPTAPDQIVELTTDRSTYAHGDTAHLTLTNLGPANIDAGSIGCSLRVIRRVDDYWEFAFQPRNQHCGLIQLLQPGDHIRGRVVITPEDFVPPGAYRFTVDYWLRGTLRADKVSSATFTVE